MQDKLFGSAIFLYLTYVMCFVYTDRRLPFVLKDVLVFLIIVYIIYLIRFSEQFS